MDTAGTRWRRCVESSESYWLRHSHALTCAHWACPLHDAGQWHEMLVCPRGIHGASPAKAQVHVPLATSLQHARHASHAFIKNYSPSPQTHALAAAMCLICDFVPLQNLFPMPAPPLAHSIARTVCTSTSRSSWLRRCRARRLRSSQPCAHRSRRVQTRPHPAILPAAAAPAHVQAQTCPWRAVARSPMSLTRPQTCR